MQLWCVNLPTMYTTNCTDRIHLRGVTAAWRRDVMQLEMMYCGAAATAGHRAMTFGPVRGSYSTGAHLASLDPDMC
jgi:hypothetical protein